ncbi:MAG: hypothetical protein QOF51_4019, partial [Chloroflexota bacterium]|nr:hypothetical protein [Chloroflexota bacterium]
NRGAADDRTDVEYARAVDAALRGGVNLIDTSINYRRQRSERAVNAGLRVFVGDGGGARDGVVVCTKGGYLVPGAFPIGIEAVAGGVHCIHPAFLRDQLARSRRNLGLETIDVYYLHNPEKQLEFVDRALFMERMRAAFECLEQAVSEGLVRHYGTATWDGYHSGALSLRALVGLAQEIAGDDHHLRFVQLPFNLGMREAPTVLEVAAELGVTVVASATLRHATDARRAIRFVLSTPGISTALVGMRSTAHVAENLAASTVPP